MSEPFIGELRCFGFNFPPQGYARCDGQLLPISQNTALFSLLGTQYGGDGETTFALPDLRGRAAVHYGNGPGLPNVTIGQEGGAATTTLSVANLPAHNHDATLNAIDANAGLTDPEDAVLAIAREDTYSNSTTATSVPMRSDSVSVGITGNGTAFNNLSPFLGVNWCIALVGIFPSP